MCDIVAVTREILSTRTDCCTAVTRHIQALLAGVSCACFCCNVAIETLNFIRVQVLNFHSYRFIA